MLIARNFSSCIIFLRSSLSCSLNLKVISFFEFVDPIKLSRSRVFFCLLFFLEKRPRFSPEWGVLRSNSEG